jgi:hypothetical protein
VGTKELLLNMFNPFKKKINPGDSEVSRTFILKTHTVNGLFYIGLPVDWKPFESDRFRAKTQDGKTQISITNYRISEVHTINKLFFEDWKLHLYDDFVTKGGYEPYDDLLANNQYISKSFKVDEETQYYLTTAKALVDSTMVTDIIIRDIGNYDIVMLRTLPAIFGSITWLTHA